MSSQKMDGRKLAKAPRNILAEQFTKFLHSGLLHLAKNLKLVCRAQGKARFSKTYEQ